MLAVNECSQLKPLSLSLVNIRSVKSKSADFLEFVLASQADIVTLVKTWLTPDDVAARKEAVPNGYMLLDQPRIGRKGGGIAILYKKSISVKKVRSGELDSFEYFEAIVKHGKFIARLVTIYRPIYA